MIKTQKTRIAALLLVLITLLSALFIPINAAVQETSEDIGIEEIMPMAANNCGQWIDGIYYNNKFLGEANSKYEYYNSHNDKYVMYFDTNGRAMYNVHYSDHGSPGSHSNPHYHTFSAVYNDRMGGYCWQENSQSMPGLPNV